MSEGSHHHQNPGAGLGRAACIIKCCRLVNNPDSPSRYRSPGGTRAAPPGLQGESGAVGLGWSQHFLTLHGSRWPAQGESPPFIGIMMISIKATASLLSTL